MTTAQEERLLLIDAVVYGDAFDCAVTFDELWRFSRVKIGRRALERRLRSDESLRSLVAEHDGYYCLRERRELLELRPERLQRAEELRRRARRVARIVRFVPFVRGLALTGSAAAGDARARADVDLLVVVAPNRLATVFLILGAASRLLGRRLFCPNYYAAAGRLAMDSTNPYVARELAQSRSLGAGAAMLWEDNPWLRDVFPNLELPDEQAPRAPRTQRLLELPLRGRLGDRLERRARHVARARLRAHHATFGESVPLDVAQSFDAGSSLRFHACGIDASAVTRYEARRAAIAERLGSVEALGAPS